ncbi:MAG: hypothetical protein ACI9TH_002348 [Kiritimatiellia bacterium]|jgi:hypothetical protein
MIKKIFLLPLLLLGLALTGCMESGTMLIVNTDGSGTIIARAFVNDQAMQGFAGGFGLGDEPGAAAPDVTASIKAGLEGAAKTFGDVKFESIKEAKNKLGWKGYEATYSFTDANKIKLASAGIQGDQGGGGMKMGGDEAAYKIKFTPGNPAKLEMIADMPDDAEANAEVPAEAAQSAQMMAMMAPMLKGMRMSYLVKVNGTVVESNGKYLNKNAGTLLLMDMEVDKLLGNPDGMKMLTAGKPDFAAIADQDIPGLKVHNPKVNVVITFK